MFAGRAAAGRVGARAIAIEHVVVRGEERVVLYRFRGAFAWRAEARARGTLEAQQAEIEAQRERCDACDGESPKESDDACKCRTRVSLDPFVAAEGISDEPFVWEIARVAPTADHAWQIAARTRLSDISAGADEPSELAVSDLDGDGALEIRVIASVIPLTCSTTRQEDGVLGFVLRWQDLTEQFAFTSEHSIVDLTDEITDDHDEPSSVSTDIRPAERRTAAGHADLELVLTRDEGADTTYPCPYSPSSDTWTCGERTPAPPFWRAERRTDCHSLGVLSWKTCRPAMPARCRKRR